MDGELPLAPVAPLPLLVPRLQLPGERTRTSLGLPTGLSQDDWIACGRVLAEVEGAIQWWIGDWWAFGEHTYGDRKAIVDREDWRGPAFQTCANAASVCIAFETSRRRELVSFSHHAEVAGLPVADADFWLDRAEREDWSRNQLRAAIKQGAAFQRTRDVEFNAAALGKFCVIYADPPWRYENPPMGGSNRAIENHYPTMELDAICAMPVVDAAHDNCVLFLWATSPKLYECMKVLDAWGFTYRTDMVWVKDQIGMGYHVRGRHESLLIAKRGELPPPAAEDRPDSVIEAPRLDHSAKPPTFYEIIDRMYPGVRKLEIFGRTALERPDWVCWGNQVPDAAE
jgi:N6-adenosine-specific RNA methylase IME4